MEFPKLQELFDAVAYIPAPHLCMYADMDDVVLKHLPTMKTHGMTDAYFDDLAEVAERYGVRYVNPKFKAGLSTVDTRPTMH